MSPPLLVRPLGRFEGFFQSCYELFGAYLLGATFDLSKPITLAQLNDVATYLRSRHRILQVTAQIDWDKRRAYYFQSDHLNTHVLQYDGPLTPDELMLQLVDGDFPDAVTGAERRERRMLESKGFLSWRLMLLPSGDRVVFTVPHSQCDGQSLDIIGADIVYCLNGMAGPNTGVVEVVPPVEELFGRMTLFTRLKYYARQFYSMSKRVDLGGVDRTHVPQDWLKRQTVLKRMDFKMAQLATFYERCRKNGVSLNSGMLSELYEVLAKMPEFNTAGRGVTTYVALDARRKVSEQSPLGLRNVGLYIGGCLCTEDGTSGRWVQRAKSIQEKVHSGDVRNDFIRDPIKSGLVLKFGRKVALDVAEGPDFGRNKFMTFSNIGRTLLINRANEECGNASDAIVIERFSFVDGESAVGMLLSVFINTVGDNLVCVVATVEPLVTAGTLERVCEELRAKLIT